MSDRLLQIRSAQHRFKQSQKRQNQARLDVFISVEARTKLAQGAQGYGLSQKEYLEYLLMNHVITKGVGQGVNTNIHDNSLVMQSTIQNEVLSLTEVDEKVYRKFSFYDFLRVIKKQAFWLERLQKINDALIQRVALLESKLNKYL